jgi:hypothetical protein
MCSQRLWRRVRLWALSAAPITSRVAGCRLGPWAATVANEDDRQPVLAIDVGTYLTVAFPLGGPAGFHDAFGAAVGATLEDFGVAAGQIQIEMEAVTTLSLRRLVDASLSKPLETVDFMCGVELAYHTDLRVVQRRLNDFPHAPPPDYVPATAVRRLFGLSEPAASTHVH